MRVIPLFVVVGLLVGCGPQAAPPPAPVEKKSASDHDHDHDHDHEHGPGHAHAPGPHGGTIADWGGGKYHVEFVVDHARQEATVYVLGTDEKTAVPVKTADGTVLLALTEPAAQVTLKAAPLDGEAEGTSSRYVGTHEALAKEQTFAGSLTTEIDGTPYSADFKEESHAGHDHK